MQNKKKLLQINSVVNFGSTGRIAEEIGQEAISFGWESHIAYGRKDRPSTSRLYSIGSTFGLQFHGLLTRLFDRHGLGSERDTRKLIAQIEIIKPSLIHLHNLHGYYINIEVLFDYLKKSGIPTVWTLHDCWSFTGHCAHFSLVGCEKWKTQCGHCPEKKAYPSSMWLDRSKENYILKKELFNSVKNLMIVPVSHWLGGMVQQSFLSKCAMQVINNGIDIDVFFPQKEANSVRDLYGIGSRYMLVGVASVWTMSKGFQDYLELAKILPTDCILVLIGLNQKEIEMLPENIIGIHRTESLVELAQFYSSADIVLNLSYEESFGLTTVEGFSCGTPGIVYNCTASPELMTPDTGIVIERGDILGLLDAIKQIQSKGKAYYSQACIDRVRKCYNKKDRYRDYLNLYEALLKKKVAKSGLGFH